MSLNNQEKKCRSYLPFVYENECRKLHVGHNKLLIISPQTATKRANRGYAGGFVTPQFGSPANRIGNTTGYRTIYEPT